VFNPTALSYCNTAAVASLYRQFEQEKSRRYEEVEMGSFTPLVFSTFGKYMGGGVSTVYKRLHPCSL